jgi:hypothetical protein
MRNQVMSLPAISVLASAHAAYSITDGLEAVGFSIPHTWKLPDRYGSAEAAALAELAAGLGEWVNPLGDSRIVITAFDNPAILQTVVIPYVLPHLPREAVWLQMGPVADTHELEEAAQRAGVCLVHAPLQWSADGQSAHSPLAALPASSDQELAANAALAYGLTIAALLKPGLGLKPRGQMDAKTANTLAQLEIDLASAGTTGTPHILSGRPRLRGLELLSEETLAEIEARGLVDPTLLHRLLGTPDNSGPKHASRE